MNALHPHWHATDEGEAPVLTAQAHKRVSRLPAAIVGMVLAISLGGYVLLSIQSPSLTGQTSRSVYKVIVTDDGIIPESLTASPGSDIEILNKSSESISLKIRAPMFEGDDIVTPDIPVDERFFTSVDLEAGSYVFMPTPQELENNLDAPYLVVLKQDDNGNLLPTGAYMPIAIEQIEDTYPTDPEEDPSESAAQEEEGFPSENPPLENQPTETFPPLDTLEPPSEPNDNNMHAVEEGQAKQQLPQNPYTVRYGNLHGSATPKTNVIHAGAPLKPIRQPATGAAEWIVATLSIAAVTLITRSYFRRVRAPGA